MLTNVSKDKKDTRLILNKGLTIIDSNICVLGLREEKDVALFQSVDNKKIVRNMSLSQTYVSWTHFLTYSYNQGIFLEYL